MSFFSNRPSTAIHRKVTFDSGKAINDTRPKSAMAYKTIDRTLSSATTTTTLRSRRKPVSSGWMSEVDYRREKMRGSYVHSRCSNVPNYADSVNKDLERNISILKKSTHAVASYKGNPRYNVVKKEPTTCRTAWEKQQAFEFVHCVAPIQPLQRPSTPNQSTKIRRTKKSTESENLRPWQQRPKIKTEKQNNIKRYDAPVKKQRQKKLTGYRGPAKDFEQIPLNPETSLEDLSNFLQSNNKVEDDFDGNSSLTKDVDTIQCNDLKEAKENLTNIKTELPSSQSEILVEKQSNLNNILSDTILISSTSSTKANDLKKAIISPRKEIIIESESPTNHSNDSIHDNKIDSPRKQTIRVKTKKSTDTTTTGALNATQGYFPIQDIRTMTYEVRNQPEEDLEVIDIEQQPKDNQSPIGFQKKIPTFMLKPDLGSYGGGNRRVNEYQKEEQVELKPDDTPQEQTEITSVWKPKKKPHRMLEKPEPFLFDPLKPVNVVSIDSTLWRKRSSHFDIEKLLEDNETDEEMKKRINEEQNVIKLRKPWLQGRLAMFRDENRFELPADLAKLEDMTPLNYLEIHCRVSQRRRTMYSVIFRKFDRDRDGYLEYKDVIKSLQNLHNNNLTDENITTLFEVTGVTSLTTIDSAQFIVLSAYSERLATAKNKSSSFYQPTQLSDKHLVEEADFWGIKTKLDTSNANLPLRRLLESV